MDQTRKRSPSKERRYRARVLRTLNEEIVQVLEKTKTTVTERRAAFDVLEKLFSEDDVVELLEGEEGEGETWLSTFQAVFSGIMAERAAYIAKGKEPTIQAENKLTSVAARLRWLTGRALHKIRRRVLESLYSHLTEAISHHGQLLKPLAKEYTATLRLLLSYPPHLDHTTPQMWRRIMVLAFTGIFGDYITLGLPWFDNTTPTDGHTETESTTPVGGTSRKRSRPVSLTRPQSTSITSQQPLSPEQIEFMNIVHILLRAPNAPLLVPLDPNTDNHLVTDAILSKFRRFFREYPSETSAHQEAVWALSSCLSQLELNARDSLLWFAPEMMPDLLALWRGKSFSQRGRMKEGLLVAIRILMPFVFQSESGLPIEPDVMCKQVAEGMTSTRGMGLLPLESLRLTYLPHEKDQGPFTARTFEYGHNFEGQHAFLWCALELHADCVAKHLKRRDALPDAVNSSSPRKRPRLDATDPLLDLLKPAMPTTLDARLYALEVVLFLIDHHWSLLKPHHHDTLLTELLNLLNSEDQPIQSMSFLCLSAVIAAVSDATESRDPKVVAAIAVVWASAVRRIGNPLVCRTACHAMHILLVEGCIEHNQALKDIERMIAEITWQGPPLPYDSVCHFFSEALRLTHRNVRLHHLGLETKVLSWLAETWMSADLSGNHRQLADPYKMEDLLHLLESICGLERDNPVKRKLLLPDSSIVDWMLERSRTDTIRNFFLHARLPQVSQERSTLSKSIHHTSPPVGLEGNENQGMPSPTANKCTTFLLKAVDQAMVFWESSPDMRMVQVLRIRSALELAILAMMFETSLHLNGVRYNIKSIRRAYSLLILSLQSFSSRAWTDQERAIVAYSLDPVVNVDDGGIQQPAFEVMVKPVKASGLRTDVLTSLTVNPAVHEPNDLMVSRQLLWHLLHKCVDVSEIATLVRQFIASSTGSENSALSGSAGNPVMDDDDFGESYASTVEGRNTYVAPNDHSLALVTWMSTCIRLALASSSVSLLSQEPLFLGGIIEDVFRQGQEGRTIQIGPLFCHLIRKRMIMLSLMDLSKVLEWFEVLASHEYGFNESAHLFVIDVLSVTIGQWLPLPDSKDGLEGEVRQRVQQLCSWLFRLARRDGFASWRVREAFARFLELYISQDPYMAFFRLPKTEGESSQDVIDAKLQIVAKLAADVDSRVRFRAATAHARILGSLVAAGLAQPEDVYKIIFERYSVDLDGFEPILTRFLSLGNLMVINSQLSRRPYWNLIEAAFFSSKHVPFMEAVLDASAASMGLQGRSALFRVYATTVADAECRLRIDFTQFPPSVLGFQNRKELLLQSFKLICPTYFNSSTMRNDPLETFVTPFATGYMDKAGLTREQALSHVLPDILGYMVAFSISEFSRDSGPTFNLSLEQATDLEAKVMSLASHASSDRQPMDVLLQCWDRIVYSILSLNNDTECSEGGPIHDAIQNLQGPDAAATFLWLTKYRKDTDYQMHKPGPPATSALTVMRSLKWFLAFMVGRNQGISIKQAGAVYHVLSQLLAAIDNSPVLNDQYRLFNALCIYVARHQQSIRKDSTLLNLLMRGTASLLRQRDLATASQSVLDWCFTKTMSASPNVSLSLSNIMGRIASTADEYSRNVLDASSASLGIELFEWIEGWAAAALATIGNQSSMEKGSTLRDEIIAALMSWPRAPVDALRGALDELPIKRCGDILRAAGVSAGTFRIVRRLQEEGDSLDHGPWEHFWPLKACIPSAENLRDGDCDAFVDLLWRSAARLDSVADESTATSLALRFFDNSSDATQIDKSSPETHLILALHSMLLSETMSASELAYHTLREILATGYEFPYETAVRGDPIPSEMTFLKTFRVSVSECPPRSLSELGSPTSSAWCRDFDTWVTSITVLLSSVLTADYPFFGPITRTVLANVRFAEEAFPLVVRHLLSVDAQARDTLGTYFTRVLQHPDAALACKKSIIHLVLHLRHFRQLENEHPLSRNYQLGIHYKDLATAATQCGLYTSSLLFLEIASESLYPSPGERMPLDETAEDALYTIYSRIEEPDGFYGIKTKELRRFLSQRFRHEAQWDRTFQFQGAAYEADPNVPSEAHDIISSLHSFGFNRLALQVLSSVNSQDYATSSSEVAYSLGWRTETWDLPAINGPRRPDETLYAALHAVHRERSNVDIQRTIRTLLREEMVRLHSIGNEDMMAVKESNRLLLCLAELQRCGQLAADGDYDGFTKAMPHFDFPDLETILSTRISYIRSKRFQEQADQIGDLVTGEAVTLARAEFTCLVRLCEAARANERPQIALNALQKARCLPQDAVDVFILDREFAVVLWMQGEHRVAVDQLRSLLQMIPGNDSRRPSLLSQLGEWSSQAALEKPVDIQNNYFNEAVENMKACKAPHAEMASIFRRFARFTEQQHLSLVRSPDAAILRSNWDDMAAEVSQLENAMKGISAGTAEWKKFQGQLRHSRRDRDEYERKFTAYMDTSSTFLRLAINMFAKSLALVEGSEDLDTIIRLCALWFGNFNNDALNTSVRRSLTFIPTHKLIFLSHQLSSRLSPDSHEGQVTLGLIMRELASHHTFHTFYQLFALSQGGSNSSNTNSAGSSFSGRRASRNTLDVHQGDDARAAAAEEVVARLTADPSLNQRVTDLVKVCEAYLQWAKYVLDSARTSRKGDLQIPSHMTIGRLKNVPVPVATDDLEPDPTGQYKNFVSIKAYEPKFSVAGGMNLPKISVCIGSDGRSRKQLFKGQGADDMRQDAVMEQVFVLVNFLLARDRQTQKRSLSVRTYKVIPLAPQAGLIEFVPGTQPLKTWLDAAHHSYRRQDMSDGEATKRMMTTRDRKRDLVAEFTLICNKLKPVMRHFFTEQAKLPMAWFRMQLNYSRSVATTSIVGHMIGLGDRHTSNILLQLETGEVVHIDLGYVFDQGRKLPVPELVPFRLTRDMIDGLGISGTEGVFRRCAEETLRVLREDSSVIMTVLDVFKTDPL
ncbi:Serine/threonine-protein kinase tel1, partial [Tulasnella sp. 403]